MISRIDTISLKGLLPRVFAQEEIPSSQIWRSSCTLERGGRYLIEAASGAGKSSLAAFLIGSRRDYEGSILFNGDDIRNFDIAAWQEIRHSRIAYLPQELALFAELSAFDNIMLKAEISGFSDIRKIESWIRRLGIESRRDYPAGRLSIGQQQRVALIRSLCQPFDFIMLDEPVSHLDEHNNRIAAGIVEEEARSRGAAVVTFSVGNPLLIENAQKLRL